jgi:HTH-type transcriptional regulator, quorum sensing regulator NprR
VAVAMHIGEKIRQLRMMKNMRQSELVEGICSVAYLSRIENGKTKPSAPFIRAVCQKLGIVPDDICDDDSNKKKQRIANIINQYKKTRILNETDEYLLKIAMFESHLLDTRINIYTILIRHYLTDNRISEAQQVFQLSKKSVPDEVPPDLAIEFFYYYLNCGNIFFSTQDYIKATHYYELAERLSNRVGEKDLAILFYNLSLVKQHLSQDKTICLHYSQKSLDIHKKLGNEVDQAKVLITKATQYNLNHQYNQAIKCLDEALEIVLKTENVNFLGMIEYNYGRAYQSKGEIDTAIKHYETCLQLRSKIGAEQPKVHTYRELILIYMERKDLGKVDQYLKEGLRIAETYQQWYHYVEFHMFKALLYKSHFQEQLYEKETQRLIDMAVEKNQLNLAKKMAHDLGRHYYEKNAYKKAADFYDMALRFEALLHAPTTLADSES